MDGPHETLVNPVSRPLKAFLLLVRQILFRLFPEREKEAPAHLACGLTRERDRRHVVDFALAFPYHRDHTIHQRRRLASASAGKHHDIAVQILRDHIPRTLVQQRLPRVRNIRHDHTSTQASSAEKNGGRGSSPFMASASVCAPSVTEPCPPADCAYPAASASKTPCFSFLSDPHTVL